MARLSAGERARLPDRAFAHVDAEGNRRLPIVDAAHVRNALARFNQVSFASDHERDAARERLLRAARKYRIVPVGFISSQIRSERAHGIPEAADLPTGFVTLLLSDIEGSTSLLATLGDDYGAILDDVRRVHTVEVERTGGHVVEARADEFFAVFESPRAGVDTAIGIQRAFADAARSAPFEVRVRLGLHAGYPTRRGDNYIGMAVHTAARICDAAHGGQVVVSGDAREALTGMLDDDVSLRKLGRHRLRGIPVEQMLFQVRAPGLRTRFGPLRL